MEKFAYSDWHAGICLAVDASGLQPNERGEWMRDKWKLCRGFIKMHITIEVKTRKIAAVSVTTEEKTDSSQLPVLLKDAAVQVAHIQNPIQAQCTGIFARGAKFC